MSALDLYLLDLAQRAADRLAPWIGCYRAALWLYRLWTVLFSLFFVIASHGWRMRGWALLGIGLWLAAYKIRAWQLKSIEDQFNVFPYWRYTDKSLRVSLAVFTVLFVAVAAAPPVSPLDGALAAAYVTLIVAHYLSACAQIYPPARFVSRIAMA